MLLLFQILEDGDAYDGTVTDLFWTARIQPLRMMISMLIDSFDLTAKRPPIK